MAARFIRQMGPLFCYVSDVRVRLTKKRYLYRRKK
nr:MAG TPA: hypothetical protein [Caudoviricetes sp.]